MPPTSPSWEITAGFLGLGLILGVGIALSTQFTVARLVSKLARLPYANHSSVAPLIARARSRKVQDRSQVFAAGYCYAALLVSSRFPTTAGLALLIFLLTVAHLGLVDYRTHLVPKKEATFLLGFSIAVAIVHRLTNRSSVVPALSAAPLLLLLLMTLRRLRILDMAAGDVRLLWLSGINIGVFDVTLVPFLIASSYLIASLPGFFRRTSKKGPLGLGLPIACLVGVMILS